MRAAFGRYLSKEAIDKILDNPEPLKLDMKAATIHFVLFQVSDDDLGNIQALLSRAIDIALEFEGMVDIFSSTLMATFGYPRIAHSRYPNEDFESLSMGLAAKLVEDMGRDVRAVYGSAEGAIGNLGNQRRFSYGPAIPGFHRILAHLGELDFGTVEKA
jgi:hypothetical protein